MSLAFCATISLFGYFPTNKWWRKMLLTQVVTTFTYKMEQGEKESLLPWGHSQDGARSRTVRPGEGPVGTRQASRFSKPPPDGREGSRLISPAFPSHRTWLSPTLVPETRPGGNVCRNSQAALWVPTWDTEDRRALKEVQPTHLSSGGMEKSPAACKFPVTSLSFTPNAKSHRH